MTHLGVFLMRYNLQLLPEECRYQRTDVTNLPYARAGRDRVSALHWKLEGVFLLSRSWPLYVMVTGCEVSSKYC